MGRLSENNSIWVVWDQFDLRHPPKSPSGWHGFLLNHCSHCLVILSGTKNPVRDRDDNRKRDRQQSVLSLPGHRFLLTLAP